MKWIIMPIVLPDTHTPEEIEAKLQKLIETMAKD